MMNLIEVLLPSKKLKLVLFGLLSISLSSCSSNTDDLSAWVARIKAQPAGRIEPMPEVKEYKPHDYSSAHLKSPFSELEPELEVQLKLLHDGCDDSISPDVSRRKEELERYSLDSMEMVGMIERVDKKWGLIKMTAGPTVGVVKDVRVGEYLGINHGRIVAIDESQIEVKTLVPDSKGCWEERTIYMALAQ
jgi:type IV pilus assembly protein PilP